jgi:hypothetical protein
MISTPIASPPTPPMARPRCWNGWSTSKGSHPTSRSSTSPAGRTGPSPEPTSSYDPAADLYRCPGGQELKQYRRAFRADHPETPPDDTYRYRASKMDGDGCALKPGCCPNGPARKVTRSIHEAASDVARVIAKTDAYVTSRRERKKVEMLFATPSASSGWIACDFAVPAARETSSSSLQPPRTCE